MSQTIDERIVSMQFDNKDFERNVQSSLDSLERLNKSLEFKNSSKSLKNLTKQANKIDFSKLDKNIEKIADRMSTAGIIGAKVISDITGAAEKGLINIANKIKDLISTGGLNRAMSIEEAKFQLKGLGVAWGKIEDDINYGVKDTAYGLGAAAKVAAQLVASSVHVGDEMKKALRGVSGVAAMTHSSYEDIGEIFTSVAGKGKVQAMELNRIAIRGLNATATLRDAFNMLAEGGEDLDKFSDAAIKDMLSISDGLKVTEEDIREFAKKGLINFRIFSEAMDAAFGDHAKAANESLNGVIANIGSAFGRIGANIYQPLIKDNGGLVRVLNDVREVVNDINAATKDVIGRTMFDITKVIRKVDELWDAFTIGNEEWSGWDDILFGLERIMRYVTRVFYPIKQAIKDVFPSFKDLGKSLNVLAIHFSSWAQYLWFSRDSIIALRKVVVSLLLVFKEAFNVFASVFKVFKNTISAIGDLIAAFFGLSDGLNLLKRIYIFLYVTARAIDRFSKNVKQYIYNMLPAFYMFGEVVNTVLNGVKTVFFIILGLVAEVGGAVNKFIGKVKGIGKVTGILSKPINAVKSLKDEIFSLASGAGSTFSSMGNAVSDFFSEKVEEAKDEIKDTNKELLAIESTVSSETSAMATRTRVVEDLVLAYKGLSSAQKEAFRPKGREVTTTGRAEVKKVGPALGVGEPLGKNDYATQARALLAYANKVEDTTGKIKQATKDADNIFAKALHNISSKIKSATRNNDKLFEMTFKNTSSKFKVVTKDAEKASEAITIFGKSIEKLPKPIRSIITSIVTLGKAIKNFILQSPVGKVLTKLKDKITAVYTTLKNFFTWIHKKIKDLTKSQLVVYGIVGGFIFLMFRLASTIAILPFTIERVTTAFGNVVGLLKHMTGYKKDTVATALVKIAAAIYILAQSLKLISDIKVDDLKRSVLTLGGVIAVLTIIEVAFAKFASFSTKFSADQFNQMARAVLAYAASIYILATALRFLNEVEWPSIGKGLLTVAIAIGAYYATFKYIITAASAFETFNAKGVITSVLSLFLITIALTKLVKAVTLLKDIPSDKIEAATTGIFKLMAGMMGLALMAGKIAGPGVMFGILAVVAAFALLPKAITAIEGLNVDKMKENASKYSIAIGAVIAAVVLLALATRGIGVIFRATSTAILSVAVSAAIITGVFMKLYMLFENLSSIRWEVVLETCASFIAITAMFGLLLLSLGKLGGISKWVFPTLMTLSSTMLAFAGTIAILTFVFRYLLESVTEWKSGVKAAVVIGASLGSIAILFYGLTKLLTAIKTSTEALGAGGAKTMFGLATTFLSLSFMLMALAAAAAVMSILDPWKLAEGFAGIAVVLGIIYAIFKSINEFNVSAYKSIYALGFAALALVGCVAILGFMKGEKGDYAEMTTGIMAISFLLWEFIVMLKVLEGAGPTLQGAEKSILALSAVLLVLTGSIAILSNKTLVDPSQMTLAVIMLGGLMVVMTIVVAIFNSLSKGGPVLTQGVLALKTACISLVILAASLALLSYIDQTKIIPALGAIAGALTIVVIFAAIAQKVQFGLTVLAANIVAVCMAIAGVALAFSAAVFIICAAFTLLSEIGPEAGQNIYNFLSGIFKAFSDYMGVLFPLCGTLVTLALSFAVVSASMVLLGVGLLLCAGAFNVFTFSLKQLSEIGPFAAANIKNVIISFGEGFAEAKEGFKVFVSVLSDIALSFIGVTLAFAVSIFIISGAFYILGSAASTLIPVLLTAALVFAVFIGGIALLTLVASQLQPVGDGLLAVAAGLAVVAIVIAGIVIGINALTPIAPVFLATCTSIMSGMAMLGVGIMVLGIGLAFLVPVVQAFAEAFGIIIDHATNGIATIIQSLNTVNPSITAFIAGLAGLIFICTGFIPTCISFATGSGILALGMVEFYGACLLFSKAVALVISAFSALQYALSATVSYMEYELPSVFGQSFDQCGAVAGASIDRMNSNIVGGVESLGPQLEDAGKDAPKGLLRGINSSSDSKKAGSLLGNLFLKGFKAITGWNSPWTSMQDAATDGVDGLVSTFSKFASNVISAGKDFGLSFLEGFRDVTGWHSEWDTTQEAADDGALGFIDKLKQWGSKLINSGKEMGGKAIDGLKSMLPFFSEQGNAAANAYNDALNAGLSKTEMRRMIALQARLKYMDPSEQAFQDANNGGEYWGGEDDQYQQFDSSSYYGTKERDDFGGGGDSGKGSDKETKRSTEIMDYAKKVVEEYHKAFKNFYIYVEKTEPIEAAKGAIVDLAKEMYKVLEGPIEETEDGMADVLEKFKEYYDSISISMEAQYKSFEKLSRSYDYKPKEMLKNLKENKKALDEWEYYLEAALRRGIDRDEIYRIATAGFSPESLDQLQAMVAFTEDEVEEFNSFIGEKQETFQERTAKMLAKIAGYMKDLDKQTDDISTQMVLKAYDSLSKVESVVARYQKTYSQYFETVKEDLVSFGSSFDEWKDDNEISLSDMITNQRDRAHAMDEWETYITAMKDSGMNSELIKYITDMGIDGGYKYAKAWYEASSEEQEEFENLWLHNAAKIEDSQTEQVAKEIANSVGMSEIAEGMYGELVESIKTLLLNNAALPEELASLIKAVAEQSGGIYLEAFKQYSSGDRAFGEGVAQLVTEDFASAFASKGITELGRDVVEGITNGMIIPESLSHIRESMNVVASTVSDSAKEIADDHSEAYVSLENTGEVMGFAISRGLVKSVSVGEESAEGLANKIVTTTEGIITYDKFEEIATYIIDGLKNGIMEGEDDVITEMRDFMNDVVRTTRETVDENSPSKVMYTIGRFLDEGLANGISENGAMVLDSTGLIAENTIAAFSNMMMLLGYVLQNDLSLTPVITPVLDMTNMQDGYDQFNALFANDPNFKIGVRNADADAVAASFGRSSNMDANGNPTNVYNFTQNNYSPKALSRLEIYRQTRNQFARMKGLVET